MHLFCNILILKNDYLTTWKDLESWVKSSAVLDSVNMFMSAPATKQFKFLDIMTPPSYSWSILNWCRQSAKSVIACFPSTFIDLPGVDISKTPMLPCLVKWIRVSVNFGASSEIYIKEITFLVWDSRWALVPRIPGK